MSLAFEKFMMQYKMAGREKADGYSPDVFIGLEEHEKESVFKLLTNELPWSAEWLFALDPQRALAIAKEKEKELRGRSFGGAYLLQKAIVKYSGDLLYQEHMIEDYSSYDASLKANVIDAINCTPTNAATTAFFKQVILTETDSDAVASACIHYLDAFKIPSTTDTEKQTYDRLFTELRNGETPIKLRAISRIEKRQMK